MRQRLDLGTLLQALGAILLLVSLFVRWYTPGGTAWRVFEIVDLLLAVLAIAALFATVALLSEGESGSPAWVQALGLTALVIVAVELIDKPPAVRVPGVDIATGGWLALGGAVVMAIGALLHRARIGITIDVRDRDRRRRVSAVDRRAAGAGGPAVAARDEAPPAGGAMASDRDVVDDDLGRTQPFRPVRDDDEA